MHENDLEVVTKQVIPISLGNSVFRIRQISDTHHKGDGFREDLFAAFEKIQTKDKQSCWIHTGDIGNPDRNSRREIDNIANANRKDEIITQNEKNKLWVENFIIPKYKRLASSCLGMLAGDHYMVIDGKPCTEYICKRLNIPYIGEREGFINVVFRTQSTIPMSMQYIIHARHGKGSASNPGCDVNALIRQETGVYASLHLGGHTHKSNCHAQRIRRVNSSGVIRQEVVWYMRGGSLLDNPSYARKSEYTPLPCGWGEVELNIGRIYHGEGKSRPLEITRSKCSIVAS